MTNHKSYTLSLEEVREVVIQEFAKTQAATPDDVKKDMQLRGGDTVIKSVTATSVIGGIEGRLDVELIDQDNLSPCKRATVKSLSWHIYRELQKFARSTAEKSAAAKGGR